MGCREYSSQDLGIGFACTIGAGLATIVGAMVVIGAPSLRNRLFLAAALSFASGVMIYVSFVDIYIGEHAALFHVLHGRLLGFLPRQVPLFGKHHLGCPSAPISKCIPFHRQGRRSL